MGATCDVIIMKLAVWDCAGFKQQTMGVQITEYSAVVIT